MAAFQTRNLVLSQIFVVIISHCNFKNTKFWFANFVYIFSTVKKISFFKETFNEYCHKQLLHVMFYEFVILCSERTKLMEWTRFLNREILDNFWMLPSIIKLRFFRHRLRNIDVSCDVIWYKSFFKICTETILFTEHPLQFLIIFPPESKAENFSNFQIILNVLLVKLNSKPVWVSYTNIVQCSMHNF